MKKLVLVLLSLLTVKSFAYFKANCEGVTSDIAKLQAQGYEPYQTPVTLKLSGYGEKITLESRDLQIGTATQLALTTSSSGNYYSGKVSCNYIVNGGITEKYCGSEKTEAIMSLGSTKGRNLEAASQLGAKMQFQMVLNVFENNVKTADYTFNCETTSF